MSSPFNVHDSGHGHVVAREGADVRVVAWCARGRKGDLNGFTRRRHRGMGYDVIQIGGRDVIRINGTHGRLAYGIRVGSHLKDNNVVAHRRVIGCVIEGDVDRLSGGHCELLLLELHLVADGRHRHLKRWPGKGDVGFRSRCWLLGRWFRCCGCRFIAAAACGEKESGN